MFWKMGFSAPSNIDNILRRDNFTLEDLLNDDDILQELRNSNKQLTEFMSQPDIVQRLLGYIVDGTESDDLVEKFKYPNIAAEVLTSECWPIMEAVSQPEALEYLWRVVDKPAPLNPLLASFFSKVVQTLLQKEIEPLTTYLLGSPTLLFKLIGHLGTPAIMDVLLKMTQLEGGNEGGSPNLSQFWAEEEKLVKVLIGLFNTAESGASEAILSNAAVLLGDLVDAGRKEAIEMQEFSTPSPFLQQLTSTDILSELLHNVLSGERSAVALENVLQFFAKLLRETERGEEEAPPTEIDKQRYQAEVKMVLAALVPRIRDLHKLLEEEPEPLTTASGELKAVCGNTRLQVAGAFEALLRTPTPEIVEAVVELGTLGVLLDMVAALPNNNLLHAHVCGIVESVVALPHDGLAAELRKHLFTKCRLLQRIMDLVEQSHETLKREKAHAGFYGYVNKMANAVQTASLTPDKARDPIDAYLKDDADLVAAWRSYVTERLYKENERMREGQEKPQDTGEYSSDDDDEDGWGNEAEAAFTRYLNERINLDMPDDFDAGDDSDDSDDDGASYGVSGAYGANFSNYNSNLPASAAAGADSYAMDHPAPDGEGGADESAAGGGGGSADGDELTKNFRPPPLKVNGDGDDGDGDAGDAPGAPDDQSTPTVSSSGDAGGWAAFPPAAAGGDEGGDAGAPKMSLDADLRGSSEVEDSNVPKGSVDIEGGGALFGSSA